MKAQIALVVALVIGLTACAATPAAPIEAPTPLPPATPTAVKVTCGDVDAHWGKDWAAVLTALEQLLAADRSCGEEPLASKKYAAHFNYGAVLEANSELPAAIAQYQAALAIDPNRQEALNALTRLEALPAPTPAPCRSSSPPRPDPAPPTAPDLSSFITVSADQFHLNNQPFKVKGVNYYPRHAPWHRFIDEANPAEMAAELELISRAGFNTVRLFLWYEPLFTCEPETAIPNEAAFATVDALIDLAAAQNLKLIITLNDLPDLRFRPLYTDWPHYDAQTVYIVRRYRNEPAILAWDVRNEGDIDYGAQAGTPQSFSQPEVTDWLAHITQLVRENDPYHLITAGWWGDPLVTSPYVDFLSFHQFDSFDPRRLQNRIKNYQQHSAQPLLLEEVGYHSWAEAPAEARDESTQAKILGDVITAVEETDIAGWVVWTAFDFAPAPGQPPNYEHFFGLWRADLSPKPVLEALPLRKPN